jgi:hypothetical protein
MTNGRTSESEGVRSAAGILPQGSQGADPRNPRGSRVSDPRVAGEAARFWAKVAKGREPDDCWSWSGAKKKGYARLRVWRNGRWTHMPAHRWAYEHVHGPLPAELTPDHRCHNDDTDCPGGPTCPHRACCNPAHLEAVTHEENLRRANARRTR